MHESGVFDVQSHTRSHAKVFCDSTVTGFVTPGPAVIRTGSPLDSPNGPSNSSGPTPRTPLYLRRSRMSDARRFLPDDSTAERCRRFVAREGGARSSNARRGGPSSSGSRRATGGSRPMPNGKPPSKAEIAEGRALLNDGLGTTTVRHVALPWGIAGDVTRRALKDSAHLTAFAERPLRRRGVRAGDDATG